MADVGVAFSFGDQAGTGLLSLFSRFLGFRLLLQRAAAAFTGTSLPLLITNSGAAAELLANAGELAAGAIRSRIVAGSLMKTGLVMRIMGLVLLDWFWLTSVFPLFRRFSKRQAVDFYHLGAFSL